MFPLLLIERGERTFELWWVLLPNYTVSGEILLLTCCLLKSTTYMLVFYARSIKHFLIINKDSSMTSIT